MLWFQSSKTFFIYKILLSYSFCLDIYVLLCLHKNTFTEWYAQYKVQNEIYYYYFYFVFDDSSVMCCNGHQWPSMIVEYECTWKIGWTVAINSNNYYLVRRNLVIDGTKRIRISTLIISSSQSVTLSSHQKPDVINKLTTLSI